MVLAITLGVVIGTLNPLLVTVDLLWFQVDWPLGLVLICILILGVLLGLALCWLFTVWPLKLRLRKADKLAASGSQAHSLANPESPDA
jgi:uncharacterized membrane protein YciS (DUF1049 family)